MALFPLQTTSLTHLLLSEYLPSANQCVSLLGHEPMRADHQNLEDNDGEEGLPVHWTVGVSACSPPGHAFC